MNEDLSSDATCPRCGSALAPSTQGLCPRCVLAAGIHTEGPTQPDGSAPQTRESAPAPADIATHFSHLEIIELIGRGGMGWVYKARQTNLDRVVALKILPPDVAGDPAFAERFHREARALARLNHPNIVAVYDFGQAGPFFYFMMEFVDGANLRQLERLRRLSPEEAIGIVPKLCEALQYAHDEGIVHRDIKPENILIDGRGRLKIADFGIAKIVGTKEDAALTATRHALGTPQYMAPEQFEAPATVDHRADIYALGVVFYEMLTGELPLGRFEPPSKHVQVDVRMDDVVLKSLERNPERRYQTASAVQSDVESIAGAPVPPSAEAAQADLLPLPEKEDRIAPGDPPAPSPPNPTGGAGAFSVLDRAWREWWSGRAEWFAASVQTVLIVVHVICMIGFIGTGIKSHWSAEGQRQFTYTLGAGDPWFKYETYPTPTIPFRSGVHPAAGSMLFLLVGFAVYYAFWRIEKVRKPKVGFWSSPAALGMVWGVLAFVAVALGTKMGHDALDENILGGLFAPQLRSAMGIADVGDRDEALHRVAMQAAAAKDLKTVRRAIQEIGDTARHDQTAADCALALAKLKGAAAEATSVAQEIRTVSLRDSTLSQLAAAGAEPAGAAAADAPPALPDERESLREVLVTAAAKGDVGQVVELLYSGLSVNDKNAGGQTALMQAVAHGHHSLALTLILLGANILEQDSKGMNAVMHAVERRDPSFISLLSQLSTISYEQDAQKRRDTLKALPGVDRTLIGKRDVDLVQFSAAHEVMQQTDKSGEPASIKAARAGDWEIYQLVSRSVDSMQARSADGRTAAMHFVAAGTAAPFEELRKSHLFGKVRAENGFLLNMVPFGVDQLALVDRSGRTALQLARDLEHVEIADILWRHLENIVRGETAAIERIEKVGLTAGEKLGRAEVELSIPSEDELTRTARITDEILRDRYETRSLAWQALGETARAKEDFERSKRPTERRP